MKGRTDCLPELVEITSNVRSPVANLSTKQRIISSYSTLAKSGWPLFKRVYALGLPSSLSVLTRAQCPYTAKPRGSHIQRNALACRVGFMSPLEHTRLCHVSVSLVVLASPLWACHPSFTSSRTRSPWNLRTDKLPTLTFSAPSACIIHFF